MEFCILESSVDVGLHVALHLAAAIFLLSEGVGTLSVLTALAVTITAHVGAKAIVHLVNPKRKE